MSVEKSFTVFGDPVEVLASAATTGATFSVVTQLCAPGGGPPPHLHAHEDEFFVPLSGEFELFEGSHWTALGKEGLFAPRGHVHTFPNRGQTHGKILILISPGGIDRYLEEISTIVMPGDKERLVAISDAYGISFVPGP